MYMNPLCINRLSAMQFSVVAKTEFSFPLVPGLPYNPPPDEQGGGETLEIATKTQDGVKVVKLKGRLSVGPALDRFNSTLGELLRQGQNQIVLDLEEVPTIDSSGVGMLVRHLTVAKQGGGAIRLLKPSAFTMKTLKMVGLLNLFTTFDDLPRAIASFQ